MPKIQLENGLNVFISDNNETAVEYVIEISKATSLKRIADVLEDAFGANTREEQRRQMQDHVFNLTSVIGGIK